MHGEDLKGFAASSPGPPTCRCQANFSAADFHSVDLAWEVWFTISTIAYLEVRGALSFEKAMYRSHMYHDRGVGVRV